MSSLHCPDFTFVYDAGCNMSRRKEDEETACGMSRGRNSTFRPSLSLLCLTRRGCLWDAEQVQPVREEPSGAAGAHHSLCCLLPDFPQHCQRRSDRHGGRNRSAGLHHAQVRKPQGLCLFNKDYQFNRAHFSDIFEMWAPIQTNLTWW